MRRVDEKRLRGGGVGWRGGEIGARYRERLRAEERVQAGQDGRRRDTHHVNNTLLRRKTEPTSLVSPRESHPLVAHPRFSLFYPSLVSSSCFSFHDLSSASQPASQPASRPRSLCLDYIHGRTMMRSLAAIFPGFLPPLAVINATIPCHQKGKRLRRVVTERRRERERERERERMREGNSPTQEGKAALAAEAIAS